MLTTVDRQHMYTVWTLHKKTQKR